MTLEACVAFDTRSNPIDFGVKVKLRKVEFVVGVIIVLGIIFVPLRTGFISISFHITVADHSTRLIVLRRSIHFECRRED